MPGKLNSVQLRAAINNIAEERLNKVLPGLQDRIEQDIDISILNGMNSSSTVASLTSDGSNELRQELGLTDSEEKVAELIVGVQESVTTELKPLRGGVRAKQPVLRVKVNVDNLRNLSNRDFAFQVNTPRGDPELLPWLKWLLEGGKRAVVKNSRILRNRIGFGRNRGGSIMSRNDPTGSWKVPAEHSGTISNNFITRVLDNISDDVRSIIIKRLNASLSKIKRGT